MIKSKIASIFACLLVLLPITYGKQAIASSRSFWSSKDTRTLLIAGGTAVGVLGVYRLGSWLMGGANFSDQEPVTDEYLQRKISSLDRRLEALETPRRLLAASGQTVQRGKANLERFKDSQVEISRKLGLLEERLEGCESLQERIAALESTLKKIVTEQHRCVRKKKRKVEASDFPASMVPISGGDGQGVVGHKRVSTTLVNEIVKDVGGHIPSKDFDQMTQGAEDYLSNDFSDETSQDGSPDEQDLEDEQ